jgi:hypothetical protein
VRERGGTESERRGKEWGKQGRKLTKINEGVVGGGMGSGLKGGGFRWYGFLLKKGGYPGGRKGGGGGEKALIFYIR